MATHPFYERIRQRHHHLGHSLCLGLDPDMDKLPAHYSRTIAGIDDFLQTVIAASCDHVVAYKPNIAFFEALGIEGLRLLEKLMKRINGQVPVIMDAKRGDIGNTARMQARYIFDYFGADAVTLHPYMGEDSMAPFFEYKNHWHFVLVLTSNPGSVDIEKQPLQTHQPVYMTVLNHCQTWHKRYGNVGCVVGATQDDRYALRQQDPDLLFLIPGVGQQGGCYHDAYTSGKNKDGLALISVSRTLLYPHETGPLTQVIPALIHAMVNPR